ETELAAYPQRHVRDPPCVRVCVLVLGLERVRERLDRGEERPLELAEGERVRDRELGLVRDAAEQLELSLAVLVGRERLDADRPGPAVDRERRDRVDPGPTGPSVLARFA